MYFRLKGLAGFFLITAIWQPAEAQSWETREKLIQLSLAQLHAEQFDSGLATCAELRRRWPEDPAGYLNAANVYQTMMRDYRVRLFEAQFDSLIRRAVQLAESRAHEHSSAENFFALGTAKGYRALHRFRRGEWSPALRDALIALHVMNRALAHDPAFVDPGLALALYEYWKSVKLDFGLGLFTHKREFALGVLQKIWGQGRYVSVDAAYALQTIHLQKGDAVAGLEINEWLYARFPNNPICLYQRALLFEKDDRPVEALAAWEKLIGRIGAFDQASDGFLAECHLHRAQCYEHINSRTPDSHTSAQAWTALQKAALHAQQRQAEVELEGPLVSFDEINKEIKRMMKKYSAQVKTISPSLD